VLTDGFPRVDLCHVPTPLEPMKRLSAELGGADIWVKRDDCTGLAMGGNKARQLEFYMGDAVARGSDMVLTSGATQSNHVRMTVAAARKLGLDCEVQLEERVAGRPPEYYRSGNPFLIGLLGARVLRFQGDDEDAANDALYQRAEELRAQGRKPHVIPISADHQPLGALGYVLAAEELLKQTEARGLSIDAVVLPSGSGTTHAGMLAGLRALGCKATVHGFCVRRDAAQQTPRVFHKACQVADMIGAPGAVTEADAWLDDSVLGPGYGQLTEGSVGADDLVARLEGILLEPVYTGRAMEGLIDLVRGGRMAKGKTVVFLHTGGAPALFGYPELTAEAATA
jgi:L-cysteate sulfo-lyase